MTEYIEPLSAELIVVVLGLVEDCETLIELVLIGMIVTNVEVSVNVRVVLVLK